MIYAFKALIFALAFMTEIAFAGQLPAESLGHFIFVLAAYFTAFASGWVAAKW